MAVKKFEYYDSGDDSYDTQEASDILGQTFTPQKTHYLTQVKMKAFRLGSPGILTVGIRPTSGGLPTDIDDDYESIGASNNGEIRGQTFTPSTTHYMTHIKLKLARKGSPGTLTVNIRATSSKLPTGSAVATGYANADSFTTSTSGEWITITLETPIQLSGDAEYAICPSISNFTVNVNDVYWRYDSSSPVYSHGWGVVRAAPEDPWEGTSEEEYMFEEWGDPSVAKYEYYNTGDDDYIYIADTEYVAQTFTPSISHYINIVKIKAFRVGSPGNITVSITAVDGDGKPTGPDLSTGTFNGDIITTDSGGEWISIGMSEYLIESSTQYAIVVKALEGDATNWLAWLVDYSGSSSYTGGEGWWYDGDIWDNEGDVFDMMFEEWGSTSPTEKYENYSSDLTYGVLDVDSITTDSGGEWITITLSYSLLVSSGTEYAIVPVISNYNNGVDEFYWRQDASSPTYTRGDAVYYDGESWASSGGAEDFMFEEWGEPLGTQGLSVPDMAAMMMKT